MQAASRYANLLGFRPAHRDLLCVSLLVLACLLLRLPSLDRITLNPDESQYEATASYLVATGTPAATLPYGIPAAYGVFKLLTWLFGNYPMYQARLLVLFVCAGMAVTLYLLVRRETNRWCGALTGLLFLHHVMPYEGLTVNREWFAAPMTLAAVALYLQSERREGRARPWLLFLSGIAAGTALWFKLQAVFTVLAIPAVLLWQAAAAGRPGRALRTIGPHLLGGLVSGVGFLFPFWWSGTLGEFFDYLIDAWGEIVVGGEAAAVTATQGSLTLYARHFYLQQPYRLLLLVGLLFALLCLLAALLRLARRPVRAAFLERPALLVFVAWLIAAMFCVKLGNRFYGHYYLLMLPPLAALVGMAVHHFTVGAWRAGRGRWVALALLVLVAVDRASIGVPLLRLIPERWPETAAAALYLLAVLAVLVWGALRPLRRAGPALAALLCLECATVVLDQQVAETPRTMSHQRFRYDDLVRYLASAQREGDRLFVWGWAPEIYSLTRLEAATHITICQYVVNDWEGTPDWGTIDAWWAGMLMRDLEQRRPRFIVDAGRRGWTSTKLEVYNLARYPDFALVRMLASDYDPVGRFDGCEVYERRDPRGSP